jgi:O-antigen/teichoic acid export membrane protein
MSRRLAQNSLLAALGGAAIALANFFCTIVAARTLTMAEVGVIAYALWLVWLLAPAIDLGISSAAARFIPYLRGTGAAVRARSLGARLSRCLAVSVLVAIALLVFIAWWSGRLHVNVGDPVGGQAALVGPALVITIVLMAAQVASTFGYAHLKGFQAFGRVARIAWTSFFLQLAGVAIGSLTMGVPGALAGYTLGLLLPALAAMRAMRGPADVEPALVRRVTLYAIFAWGGNIASALVWSRLELFFLERYWGMEAVAAFAIALALTQLATQGPALLTSALLTFLAEKTGRNEMDSMKLDFAVASRLLATLVFPICFGMAAVIPVLLPGLYGHQFSIAVPAAMVLVCVSALNVTSIVGTNLVYALERSDFIFASSLLGAGLSVLTAMFLISEFGLAGAVGSRVAVQITMLVAGAWFISAKLGFPIPFAALFRLIVAASLCAATAAICVQLIGHIWGVTIGIAAGAITYIAALRLLAPFQDRDLRLLADLSRVLPPALSNVVIATIKFIGGDSQRRVSLLVQ